MGKVWYQDSFSNMSSLELNGFIANYESANPIKRFFWSINPFNYNYQYYQIARSILKERDENLERMQFTKLVPSNKNWIFRLKNENFDFSRFFQSS